VTTTKEFTMGMFEVFEERQAELAELTYEELRAMLFRLRERMDIAEIRQESDIARITACNIEVVEACMAKHGGR
jgi:hypothetical protein